MIDPASACPSASPGMSRVLIDDFGPVRRMSLLTRGGVVTWTTFGRSAVSGGTYS
jgi:hypothetical protein